jgi:hypothetical protein
MPTRAGAGIVGGDWVQSDEWGPWANVKAHGQLSRFPAGTSPSFVLFKVTGSFQWKDKARYDSFMLQVPVGMVDMGRLYQPSDDAEPANWILTLS